MEEKEYSNEWVKPVLLAALMYFTCDFQVSYITERVNGIEPWYYTSSGPIICALVFNIWKGVKNRKQTGSIWNNQNLIVNGKILWSNIFKFLF